MVVPAADKPDLVFYCRLPFQFSVSFYSNVQTSDRRWERSSGDEIVMFWKVLNTKCSKNILFFSLLANFFFGILDYDCTRRNNFRLFPILA